MANCLMDFKNATQLFLLREIYDITVKLPSEFDLKSRSNEVNATGPVSILLKKCYNA